MKDVFFLSGLPRSGSTLLGSIIGQNKAFTVTPTSPLLDLLCFTNDAFATLQQQYTFDVDAVSHNVYHGMIQGYFKNVTTDYVLDKHRGHPKNIKPLSIYVTSNPRVVCTVRPVAEIIASYIKLMNQNPGENNFVDDHLNRIGEAITVSSRAKCLWEHYISDPYNSMVYGLQTYRDHLLIVEYDDIVKNTAAVLDRVYDFLGVERYSHNLDGIHNYCSEEKDVAWGMKDLHLIRPQIQKTSTPPHEILGAFLTEYYNQFTLKY